MASITGRSSRPSSVSAYSTLGGEVGCTVRMTTPFLPSSFRRADSTLAEMGGMSASSSEKRRGPPARCQIT
jgi:hypothetical protein